MILDIQLLSAFNRVFLNCLFAGFFNRLFSVVLFGDCFFPGFFLNSPIVGFFDDCVFTGLFAGFFLNRFFNGLLDDCVFLVFLRKYALYACKQHHNSQQQSEKTSTLSLFHMF